MKKKDAKGLMSKTISLVSIGLHLQEITTIIVSYGFLHTPRSIDTNALS